MSNKDAIEIFRNSERLKEIINDHILKILMGPTYKESGKYESKKELLESGDLDESYCYLYVPKDVETYGAQGAAGIS